MPSRPKPTKTNVAGSGMAAYVKIGLTTEPLITDAKEGANVGELVCTTSNALD